MRNNEKEELMSLIDKCVSSKICELAFLKESWENGCISNREYIERSWLLSEQISNGCKKFA